MGVVLSLDCERARSCASIGLDAELSELEQALQRSHLAHCTSCAAFQRGLHAMTSELRRAPLERPVVPPAIPIPRRGTGRRALQLCAVAAAVAVAAALGSLAGSLGSSGGSSAPTARGVVRVASLSTFASARPRPATRPQRPIAL